MKKTIAKIMAAAVALSTVVAPNVSASMRMSSTVDGGIFDYLRIEQGTESGSSNVDLLTDATVLNSSSTALTTKFTPNRNDAGHITSVTTDLKVVGTALNANGDLVYYDTELEQFVVNTNTAAASTTDPAKVDEISDIQGTSLVGFGATKNDDGTYTIDGKTYSKEWAVAVIVSKMTQSSFVKTGGTVSGISNAFVSTPSLSNSSVAVSSDSAYKAVQLTGATIFSGLTVADNGTISLTVRNVGNASDELIVSALNEINPIALQVTFAFDTDTIGYISNNAWTAVGTKRVWIQLGGDLGTDYEGYVLLKKDNNAYQRIGVNYTVDANGYATIDSANNARLALDTAKGGRLLLDYVYATGVDYTNNNTRTNASTTTTIGTYKIRRIGSRVFKEGKFQQISGWGDDGAKYIRIINNGAFRKCKQLKKVNLDTEKKLRKINAKAFYDCKKLATVKLDGRNLKTIGSDAFKGCKSNITFKIKGNKNQVEKAWKKIKKQAPSKAKKSKI